MVRLFMNEDAHMAVNEVHLFVSFGAGFAVCGPAIAWLVLELLRLAPGEIIRKNQLSHVFSLKTDGQSKGVNPRGGFEHVVTLGCSGIQGQAIGLRGDRQWLAIGEVPKPGLGKRFRILASTLSAWPASCAEFNPRPSFPRTI
jgi:hypothetical protein